MNLTPPKHLTPGPWTAGGWSSLSTPIIAKDKHKATARIVASVPCTYRDFIGLGGNEAADYETRTTHAITRAIAALPQTLKALELAHDYFINLPPSQHDASSEAHLAVLAALLDSGYTRKDA